MGVRLRHGRDVGRTVGHVEGDRQHGVAVALDERVEGAHVARGRRHAVAALERRLRPLAPETT